MKSFLKKCIKISSDIFSKKKIRRDFDIFWEIEGITWLIVSFCFLVFLIIILDDPNWLRGIGFFLGGVGIAPLALLLAHSRTESLKAQTENDRQKSVTEAFAKSVELLGNKRSTARQGGIYALGRIAEDYPETYHTKVMDIVASYIRQESRNSLRKNMKTENQGKNVDLSDKDKVVETLEKYSMNMDIEAAIAVIRQRKNIEEEVSSKREYRLDLSNAYISNADFSKTNLSKVNFSDSYIVNCSFENVNLDDSSFVASYLKDSSFRECKMKACDFKNAELSFEEKSDDDYHLFRNCDLSDVSNLTGEQIEKIRKVSKDTRFPKKQSLKNC